MQEIKNNVIAAIISAIVISLIFTIWNDFVYKKDKLTGKWQVEITLDKTDYEQFQGMKLHFDYLIAHEGNKITGTGEKISEDSTNGTIEFDTNKRTHIELTGAVSYNFFAKNQIDLHCKEKGRIRDSSTIFCLKQTKNNILEGKFITTAANSKGRAVWTKVENNHIK